MPSPLTLNCYNHEFMTMHKEILCDVMTRAAAGTRVMGNFLLPAATRVPEQKQITANVLNISTILNRIYGIRILIYRTLTHPSPMNFMIVSDIFCVF